VTKYFERSSGGGGKKILTVPLPQKHKIGKVYETCVRLRRKHLGNGEPTF